MIIKSFQINHKKLIPGVYLHDHQQFGDNFITTFDLRFKFPNQKGVLSIRAIHSLEHLIATYYTENFKEKIYFGPMGCQTGFYLVVYGKKDLNWLISTFDGLNHYINNVNEIPGSNDEECGNYKTLDLFEAQREWNEWYFNRYKWGTKYE